MAVHRIAVIQWHIKALKDLALEENHRKACSFIRDAASQGAELAVLPEYHLNGLAPTNPAYIPQTSRSITQPYLESYQSLAKSLNICIVPGTLVENRPDPTTNKDRFYNIAYFISNTGQILGHYKKRNLWLPEREFLSPGREVNTVLDTPLGKVGLLVCWDLAFPEAWRELVAQGVRVVVVPTFWTKFDATPAAQAHNPDSERLLLESMITARAFENGVAIVFANAAGEDKKWLGMSRVAMPVVGTVGTMGHEEGALVAEVDLGVLDVAEECYGVRGDLSLEGWHYAEK